MAPHRRPPRDPRVHTWLGKPFPGRSWFVPLVAAIVCLAAAGIVHAVPFRWYVPLAVFAAGLVYNICVLWRVGGERYSNAIQLFMVASAATVTLWMTYASFPWAFGHVLRWWTIGVEGVLAALATPVWAACRYAQIEHEEKRYAKLNPPQRPVAAIEAAPVAPQRHEWEQIFEELGRPETRYRRRRQDKNGNIQIRMTITSPRVTFETLRQLEENLAIALSHRRAQPLPPGSITLERYRDERTGQYVASDFVVHVNVTNILANTIYIPEDHRPRTVKEAFTVGHFQDGKPFFMTVREIHWFIVAISGNGKSNLIHCLIYWLGLCEDAVIWMIDFKAGTTAKPWIMAWLDRAIGRRGKPIRRPVLDWVAIDRHEAERIFRAFIEIASSRPFWRTGSRTNPSRKRPHIILIIDEMSRVVGKHTGPATSDTGAGMSATAFAQLEIDAAAVARSEACSLIKATQRGTVTTSGDGDATANYKGRICLGAADTQDARMVHPKSGVLAQMVAALQTLGTMLAACDSPADRELPIKVFFMGDDDELDARAYEASLFRGDIVPGLHECGPNCTADCEWSGELEIANKYGYEDRWKDRERMGWVYGKHRGMWPGKPLPKPSIVDAPPDGTVAGAIGSATRMLAEMEEANRPGPAATPATAGTGFFTPPPAPAPTPAVRRDPEMESITAALGPDFVAQFSADMAALGPADAGDDDDAATADERAAEASILDRVEEIIDGYGTRGCRWTTLCNDLIAEGLLRESNKTQVTRWLKALKRHERIRQVPERGGPWYTYRNLQSAA